MNEDPEKAVYDWIANHQRYRPGAKPISSVINRLMTRRGYARIQASNDWDMAWREAVGQELAQHSRTGNIRRGVLDVFVRNSAVVQELTFCKQRLIKQLARLSPDQKVRDLRFRVGPID
jgi:predicted nucleic acid-binding Zn ribbon protein